MKIASDDIEKNIYLYNALHGHHYLKTVLTDFKSF